MRPLLTLLAIATLGVCLCACGSSSNASDSTPAQTSNTSTVHNDRDDDGDNNDDDQHVLAFGHVANAAESQAISSLIKRYYAAAATNDGKQACALLTFFIAESVVEDYGHSQGLTGKTCAVVMSKLFGMNHSELVSKSATFKILRIGVEADKSLVAIEFPTVPITRQIIARRVGDTWTMLTLLDSNIE